MSITNDLETAYAGTSLVAASTFWGAFPFFLPYVSFVPLLCEKQESEPKKGKLKIYNKNFSVYNGRATKIRIS